jgi:hypothetical protein
MSDLKPLEGQLLKVRDRVLGAETEKAETTDTRCTASCSTYLSGVVTPTVSRAREDRK